VAGRVYNVNLMIPPKAGCGRGGNGNTAFLLLDHPVHCSRAIMNFPHPVHPASIEQNALGSGGLACIYVGHNAYISYFIDGVVS